MTRNLILGLIFLASQTYASSSMEGEYTAPPEYVRVCSVFGPGYFYIPGTEICEQASTGVTKKLTENGDTVTSETQLAYRVAELERRLALLESNH